MENKKKSIFNSIINNFKDPKKLIPTLILGVIWITFSLMSYFGANIPILRFLYTITYSNGGLYGGILGFIGGIFGKVLFATFVNIFVMSIIDKKNPLEGFVAGIKGGFSKATFSSIKVLSKFVLGAGIGLIIYWLCNITSSPVNSAIAIVGFVSTIEAVGKKNSILISIINTILTKATKGKSPSLFSIQKIITGVSLGFVIGFGLTFIRRPMLLFIFASIVFSAGLVLTILSSGNGNKAVSSMLILFVLGTTLYSVSNMPLYAFEEDNSTIVHIDESQYKDDTYSITPPYVPYKGYLTYNNGGVNKYGQPFPDLMDFDGNGYMDYNDRVIQDYLVHNPDYLNQPSSGFVSVIITVTSTVVGTVLGGAIADAASGVVETVLEGINASGSIETNDEPEDEKENEEEEKHNSSPASKYISKDSEGDIHVKDPVTGEERVYVSNDDGTYTNPLTDATYTEEELKDSIESRIENKDNLREDYEKSEKAISEQREDNKDTSHYDKEAKEERIRREEEEKLMDKRTAIGMKYGVYDTDNPNDIKKAIINDQNEAYIEQAKYEEKAEYADAGYKTSKNIEKGADIAISVGAAIDPTGAGKNIKNAYTAAKAVAGRTAESVTEGRGVIAGMAQGALDGAIGVIQNSADGATEKFIANTVGGAIKEGVDASVKGENATVGAIKGFGMGALETAIDVSIDLGAGVVDAGGSEVVKTVLGTDVTKDSVVDVAKEVTGTLAKEVNQAMFADPSEKDD